MIIMILLLIMILYLTEKITLLILRGCLASLKALALREVLRGLACAGFFWIACAGSLARMLSHYNSIIFWYYHNIIVSSWFPSTVSFLLSPVSVSCLLSLVSCLLSPVSCLLSPVSCHHHDNLTSTSIVANIIPWDLAQSCAGLARALRGMKEK